MKISMKDRALNFIDADFQSGHFWPIIGRSDWCGEYKNKENWK